MIILIVMKIRGPMLKFLSFFSFYYLLCLGLWKFHYKELKETSSKFNKCTL